MKKKKRQNAVQDPQFVPCHFVSPQLLNNNSLCKGSFIELTRDRRVFLKSALIIDKKLIKPKQADILMKNPR